MSIRIFLADHHKILREGLHSLFASQIGIEIVGEASDAATALAEIQELRPAVVILEAAMPGLDGAEITRRIRAEIPGTSVVVLSTQFDRRSVIDLLRAGATAFLSKESGFDELLQAVHAVDDGHPYLGAMATGSLIDELKGHSSTAGSSSQQPNRARTLTSREIEVLQLLASGKRVKEISRLLGISVKTVESHRQNMMDKLEIHSAIELTRYALRQGLVTV
jgi:DNA-binding NarL/FixJ family response regulator